jgi:hypothetical protein
VQENRPLLTEGLAFLVVIISYQYGSIVKYKNMIAVYFIYSLLAKAGDGKIGSSRKIATS